MKKINLLLLVLLSSVILSAQQRKCRFDVIYEEAINDEIFQQQQRELLHLQKTFQHDKMDTVIYIPTVVHVIFKNNAENISTAQIMSQIAILNEDFRKRNADTTNVAAGFSKADVKFEFVLASKDPSGSPTTGITRTATTTDDIGLTNQYYALQPAWNNERYMNIWVCDVGPNFLGFAYAPNTPGVSPQEDGIVIGPEYFGNTGTAMFPYDKGRTTTHEVGHYFNLLHPWGGGAPSCSADDGIADTPNQGQEVYNCPSSNISCGTSDMLSNFLQYVDDRCMGNFTLDQKTRMRAALYNFRDSLQFGSALGLTSLREIPSDMDVQIYPNPTNWRFIVELPRATNIDKLEVEVYDHTGRLVLFQTNKLPNGLEIELSEVKSGTYFVQVKNDNFNITKKLIKY